MKPSNAENALVRWDSVFYAEADAAESFAFGEKCLARVNCPVYPMSHGLFKGFFLSLRGLEDAEPKTTGQRDSCN